jgi:hypothetical protein
MYLFPPPFTTQPAAFLCGRTGGWLVSGNIEAAASPAAQDQPGTNEWIVWERQGLTMIWSLIIPELPRSWYMWAIGKRGPSSNRIKSLRKVVKEGFWAGHMGRLGNGYTFFLALFLRL